MALPLCPDDLLAHTIQHENHHQIAECRSAVQGNQQDSQTLVCVAVRASKNKRDCKFRTTSSRGGRAMLLSSGFSSCLSSFCASPARPGGNDAKRNFYHLPVSTEICPEWALFLHRLNNCDSIKEIVLSGKIPDPPAETATFRKLRERI